MKAQRKRVEPTIESTTVRALRVDLARAASDVRSVVERLGELQSKALAAKRGAQPVAAAGRRRFYAESLAADTAKDAAERLAEVVAQLEDDAAPGELVQFAARMAEQERETFERRREKKERRRLERLAWHEVAPLWELVHREYRRATAGGSDLMPFRTVARAFDAASQRHPTDADLKSYRRTFAREAKRFRASQDTLQDLGAFERCRYSAGLAFAASRLAGDAGRRADVQELRRLLVESRLKARRLEDERCESSSAQSPKTAA